MDVLDPTHGDVGPAGAPPDPRADVCKTARHTCRPLAAY